MKRLASLLVGIILVASSSGCYCWWPWNSYGYGQGQGQGYGYQGGGCPSGNCGVAPATMMPPQTGYYQSYNTIQAGIPMGAPITAAQPVYPVTAAPLESLPTYR